MEPQQALANASKYLVVQGVLHALVFIAIVWFTVWAIRKLTGIEKVKIPEYILTMAVIIIGFGVTLQSAIITPVAYIVRHEERILAAYGNYSAVKTDETARQQLEEFDQLRNEVSVSSIFESYPVRGLLAALGCAVMLFYIFQFIREELTTPPGSAPNSKGFLLTNIFITGTLVFSVFLVITVFVAIPYINEIKKPTAYNAHTLDSVLTNQYKVDTLRFDTLKFNAGAMLFPNLKWDSVVTADTAKVPQIYRSTIEYHIKGLKLSAKQIEDSRTTAIASLRGYGIAFKVKGDNLKRSLVRHLDESQGVVLDKTTSYEYSVSYFESYVETNQTNFGFMTDGLGQLDKRNRIQFDAGITSINDEVELYRSAKGVDTVNPNFVPKDGVGAFFVPYPNYSPTVEELGDKTPPERLFGLIPASLIAGQPTELILLIGMIGFGLLGAAILSFEKRPDNVPYMEYIRNYPLIKNFGNILARGFGAAMIVYLATKGGLAIFSMGATQDPNGYILLLTCFVGAVYSQRIWDKVSTIGGSGGTGGTGGSGGGGSGGGGGTKNTGGSGGTGTQTVDH